VVFVDGGADGSGEIGVVGGFFGGGVGEEAPFLGLGEVLFEVA